MFKSTVLMSQIWNDVQHFLQLLHDTSGKLCKPINNLVAATLDSDDEDNQDSDSDHDD